MFMLAVAVGVMGAASIPIDLTTSMIHAIAFELMTRKREVLEQVAEKTPGLSVKTLTFSISFAFAEGLHPGTEGDPLAEMVGSLRI